MDESDGEGEEVIFQNGLATSPIVSVNNGDTYHHGNHQQTQPAILGDVEEDENAGFLPETNFEEVERNDFEMLDEQGSSSEELLLGMPKIIHIFLLLLLILSLLNSSNNEVFDVAM